jgi:hypothetical protein
LPSVTGVLGQAQAQFVREDVEHVDRVAQRIVPRLAGLAVGGGGGLRQRDQPPPKRLAELLEGESRRDAAEGDGHP